MDSPQQLAGVVAIAGLAMLAVGPSMGFSGMIIAAIAVLFAGPLLVQGLMQTMVFLKSLSSSKKHGKIDGYNNQYDGKEASTDKRNEDYANLVSDYYDLAT
eukprot:13046504-Heterocapsa_arctica.AAC.1